MRTLHLQWIVAVCIIATLLFVGCTVHAYNGSGNQHEWDNDDDWDHDDWNEDWDDDNGSGQPQQDESIDVDTDTIDHGRSDDSQHVDTSAPTDRITKVGGETVEAAYVAINRNLAGRDARTAMAYMTEYGRAEAVLSLAIMLEMIKWQSDLTEEALSGADLDMSGFNGMQADANPLKRTADRWVALKREQRFDPSVLGELTTGPSSRDDAVTQYRKLRDAAAMFRGQLGALLALFEGGALPEGSSELAWMLSGDATDEQILEGTWHAMDGNEATLTYYRESDDEVVAVHERYVRLAEHNNRWFYDGQAEAPLGDPPAGFDDPTSDALATNDGIEPIGGESWQEAYVAIQRSFARRNAERAMAYMTEFGRAEATLGMGSILELLLDPMRQLIERDLLEDRHTRRLVSQWDQLIETHGFDLETAGEASDREEILQAYRSLRQQPAFLEGTLDSLLSLLRMGSLPGDMLRIAETRSSDADILEGVESQRHRDGSITVVINHPPDEDGATYTERQRFILEDGRWFYDGQAEERRGRGR